MEHVFPSGARLILIRGDITGVAADAIANAANYSLAGGGGVDGAIHRAGGPEIMRELDAIRSARGGCPTGGAVATTAGRLPAKYVLHAVGPVWHGGERGEAKLLESAYQSCLDLANERGASTITFPSISTGAYGFPLHEAAPIAVNCVARYLGKGSAALREVTFVLFDPATLAAFESALTAFRGRPVQ